MLGVLSLIGVLLLGCAAPADAFQTGISTTNFGPLGCNQCHSGGTIPTVSLSGPSTVDPSSSNEYTFKINNPDGQPFGGFNVSADFGTLSIGGANSDLTQTLAGTGGRTEITHLARKAAVNGVTTFSFLWMAPDSFSSATLSAWGNAVDGNGSNIGDAAAFASLMIHSSMPGQNPTMTATPTPSPTPTPVIHDSVLAALKPLKVTIALGKTAVTKKVRVKVTNADPKTDTLGRAIQVSATSDCPAGVTITTPDFGSSPPNVVVLFAGQSKSGKVLVTIARGAFINVNKKAASRCTASFTATSFGVDPTVANNSSTMEINVIDKNNPDQATIDEAFVDSVVPVRVTIPPLGAGVSKTIKAKFGNADILPVAEKPGDALTLTATDGDCPPGTLGIATPNQATVKGGKKQAAAVPLTITSSVTSPSAKSPARCTALITVTGPTDPDPDPTNNTTRLVIDVIDKNDF